jgi:hypothetical protein
MAITINYQKRKNNNLFSKLQSNPNISLTNVQNYIPIYSRFFSLNNNNFNSINLNHNWSVSDIKDINKSDTVDNENIYICKLKNMSGDDDFSINQKIFIKMAPLLDPFKYLVGKYNHNDPDLFNMPTIDKTVKVHPKLNDHNNASYVDSFFSYLTSQVLHVHQFVNALDFYGSFMAVKNNYKINVIDDLDYLIQSEFFNKNKNTLFKIDDYSHLISETENAVVVKPLLKIQNHSSSIRSNISAKSLDDSIFEDIFTPNMVTLDDVKLLNMDLVDITNSIDITDIKKSASLKSGSSCSSRTSHTDDSATDLVTKVSDEEDELNKSIKNDSEKGGISSRNNSDSESSSNSYSSSEFEEEKLILSFSTTL